MNIFGSRLVIVIRIRGFYVKCKGVFAKTRVSSARHSGAAVWDPARRAAAGRLPPTLPPCVPRSLPYFQATTSSSPLWFPHPRRVFLGSAGAIDRDSRGRAAAGDGEGPCHLYLAETAPARSTSVPLLLKLPCLLGSSAKAHAFPPQSYQETEVRTLLLFLVAAGAAGHYRLRLLGREGGTRRKTLGLQGGGFASPSLAAGNGPGGRSLAFGGKARAPRRCSEKCRTGVRG